MSKEMEEEDLQTSRIVLMLQSLDYQNTQEKAKPDYFQQLK